MKIVITGTGGLIGWHAHARLHAANCQAGFKGEAAPYDIVALDHKAFDNDAALQAAVTGADGVLHFAGINRASEDEVEFGNQAIATRLVQPPTFLMVAAKKARQIFLPPSPTGSPI